MAPGDCSPYSAMSAAAIDPIYISLSDVPEFLDAGGEASLSDDDRACLAEVRQSTRVPLPRASAAEVARADGRVRSLCRH